MTRDMRILSHSRRLLLALAALACGPALAQSFCSSDRQTQPIRLLERFISADCESCWGDGSPTPGSNELALDWIVPGSKGDGAPLSAAATPDALSRLGVLQRAAPAASDAAQSRVEAPKRGLRVSHGLPFNGYVGTSIELKTPGKEAWSAWLLLVETIPAGTEGTPVERNLVRNALQTSWPAAGPRSGDLQPRLFESRPMSLPPNLKPERMSVVGWVQDGRGRMRAIAQSRCAAPGVGG